MNLVFHTFHYDYYQDATGLAQVNLVILGLLFYSLVLKKLVKKTKILVKICLFICEFSIHGPKLVWHIYLE